MLDLIIPDWPAPSWIKAATTTRQGGFSDPPFDSLNLSQTVGDNAGCVVKNQTLLKKLLGFTQDPLWLKQTHGTRIISAKNTSSDRVADAVCAYEPQSVCTVLTADCLPLLVCSKTKSCIAAIHAGWKGLAAGVIENSIKALACPAEDLLVWLGPAIGPQAFVVGQDVFAVFVKKNPQFKAAFEEIGNKQWLANLYHLAKQHLNTLGISAIYGGQYCTYSNKKQFFSFRRDKITGRMASLIWIQ